MSEFNWCLPMFDDPGPDRATVRPPTLEHLIGVGEAAEAGGFRALLLGTGWGQKIEAFATAAALLQHCPSIRALIAVRPGYYHPAAVAKLAATIDQHTGGRVLLNVVTGGVPSDLAHYGDILDHDARYARTREFLDIFTALTQDAGTPLTYAGQYFSCQDAVLDYGLCGDPRGRIYFGGASPPARRIAAAHADTYLMWGLPLAEAQATVTEIRQLAAAHDRTIRCGMRINIIARPDTQQAWAVAHRMLADADPATLNRVRAVAAETDSLGQQRMFALSSADTEQGDDSTGTYWTGLGRLRVGSGTALVGSYQGVATALSQYMRAGIDSFILASTPHLQECHRIGKHVLPLLKTDTP